MKVFLHKQAAARIGSALGALDLPIQTLTVDGTGTVEFDGQKIDAQAVKPDVVWLSLDVYAAGQLPLFFKTALESGSVRWLQSAFAGLDLPPFRVLVDRGVRLSNSDAQAIPIAEYVVANVLAEWHPIAAQRQAQQAHRWQRVAFREMGRSTWLIIGFGKIGQEIARRIKPFGARIIGIRRNVEPHPLADAIADLADLPNHLPHADIVVLALGLNDLTKDLADPAFLAAMKPGSFFVNIGRGGLVDEAALLQALDRGTPSLAILDVFRTEPLPEDSAFWDHPRVRMTGHSSALGDGTIGRGDALFLANIARFAAGETLLNEVTARSF